MFCSIIRICLIFDEVCIDSVISVNVYCTKHIVNKDDLYDRTSPNLYTWKASWHRTVIQSSWVGAAMVQVHEVVFKKKAEQSVGQLSPGAGVMLRQSVRRITRLSIFLSPEGLAMADPISPPLSRMSYSSIRPTPAGLGSKRISQDFRHIFCRNKGRC